MAETHSNRTMHFEVGFTLVDGRTGYWLQARYSDGKIEAGGPLCWSIDDLADFLEETLDGDDHGALANLVHMPSLPRDPGIRQ